MPLYRSLGTLDDTLKVMNLSWPAEFFSPADLPSFLGSIYVMNYEFDFAANDIDTRFTLALNGELAFRIPGLDGIQIVVGGDVTGYTFIDTSLHIGEQSYVRIQGLKFAIRFDNSILSPAENDSTDGTKKYVEISASGNITVDSNFNIQMDGLDSINLSACKIGKTGIIISAEGVKLDLSRSSSMPEIAEADFGEDFIGIFLSKATVRLPPGLLAPEEIIMENCAIGSGGFSGKVSLSWDPPALNADRSGFTGSGAGELFGIPFALTDLSLELKQNTFVDSRIEGILILPFFDQPVKCKIGLANNGDFTVALSDVQDLPEGIPSPGTADGLFVFTKEGLLELTLNSIQFQKEEDIFSIQLGGKIRPIIADFTWPSFEIKSLTIDSRGRVSVGGGWIDLPRQLTMDFYGFTLEISKFGFGSEDGGIRWIGFSGSLKLCEGLPLSGSVEGLRVYWQGSRFWLDFQGAGIAFVIPDVLEFSGRVELINDTGPESTKHGFRGAGRLRLIPTGLEINAEVIIGKNTNNLPYTFFYIYLDTQLPAGIPLFSTGTSLYEIAGLFVYNMEPGKGPADAWYDDWYKTPTVGVSGIGKWRDNRGSLGFGAGVTVGTSADNGYSVNASTIFVLIIPGPILLIEGKGSLLKDRLKSSDDPPFRALLVLDGRAGQFLLNMEAQYPTPNTGFVAKLIQVHAGAEAFFDFNHPDKWHLFLGWKDPREKRIRAEILKLFESNAYFNLYATRFEVGAWSGYDARWKFGPVKITLAAWLDGNALVSWKPVHFMGDMTFFAKLAIKVFGFGLGLSIYAMVAVEAPTPYRIYAALKVKLNLPWPLPDPKFTIELEWKETIPPPTPIPLGTIGIEHLKVSEKWLLDRYPEYNTKEEGLWIPGDSTGSVPDSPETASPVVPLDAKPVLSFLRPMVDAALIGLYQTGVVSPEKVGKYEFRYCLTEVKLEQRPKTSGTVWELVARRSADDTETDNKKLWGSWLAIGGDIPVTDSSQIPPMTKLMLFAKSPFEYARETIDDTYYDHFRESNPSYGITAVFPPKKECFDFNDILGKAKGAPFDELRRGDIIIMGKGLSAHTCDTGSKQTCLQINCSKSATVVIFPEYIRQVELTVGKVTTATAHLYNGSLKVGQYDVVNYQNRSVTICIPEDLPDQKSMNFNILIFNSQEECIDLAKVCYITAEEADRFLQEKNTADHASNAGDAYEEPEYAEAEILLPHNYYRITAVTEAWRREKGNGNWNRIQSFTDTAYFQTKDPPGLGTASTEGNLEPTAETEHYPDEGPLKDLTPYISRVIPPEGSVAVYRSYDIGAEFNEAYVETMYMCAGKPLAIYVYDNNNLGIPVPKGTIIASGSKWSENIVQEDLRRADQEWQAVTENAEKDRRSTISAAGGYAAARLGGHLAASGSVPHISFDKTPRQNGIWGGGEDFILKPGTLYRAAVVAMVPRVVIPLDTDGQPIYADGVLQYVSVASDGSNFISAMEGDYGLSQSGVMVVTDGKQFIVSQGKAGPASTAPSITQEFCQALVQGAPGMIQELNPAQNNGAGTGASTPASAPAAVYSWSFITSQYTSFCHHIHSFIDSAWDLHNTPGGETWNYLENNQSNSLRGLIEQGQTKADDIYRYSMELFGLYDRPLPGCLEIQVLEDKNGRYGFLVESPEPIAWRFNGKGRVTLGVERLEQAMMITLLPPSYSPVKLINYTKEWIELLVRADLDLSGYRIDHIIQASDGTSVSASYYTFEADIVYREGTLLRIHPGLRPPSFLSDPDRKDIFGASDLLSETGGTLKVSNPEGREIHCREFSCRSRITVPAVLAPDPDGTRTFVFLRDDYGKWVENLQAGTYRFTWVFSGNPGIPSGGDPENKLPIMRRFGVIAGEETHIEFNVPAALPGSVSP